LKQVVEERGQNLTGPELTVAAREIVRLLELAGLTDQQLVRGMIASPPKTTLKRRRGLSSKNKATRDRDNGCDEGRAKASKVLCKAAG